jgi:deazaflavin-dependent oxidoreductase (nitroreductase family)
MKRYLATPLPAGPNVLLTVRGRKTGKMRSHPASFLTIGDRRYVQAAGADVDWVRNARAAGEVQLSRAGRSERLIATQMEPEAAARLMHDALAGLPRSNLVRRAAGAQRTPVGVLKYFGLRIDDTLDQYVATARRHPVFELIPVDRTSGQPGSSR